MDNNRILLKSIADFEILNLPYVHDLSLYEGKTGRAIFFSLLGSYFRNSGYEMMSEYILNDVCSNLRCDMTVDFGKGITGIGWGLEFLNFHGFIESDLDEVLFEVDRLIERQVLSCTFKTENLVGLKKYYDARVCDSKLATKIFSETFITKLQDSIYENKLSAVPSPSLNISMHETWTECIEYYSLTGNEENPWKEGLKILNNIYSYKCLKSD